MMVHVVTSADAADPVRRNHRSVSFSLATLLCIATLASTINAGEFEEKKCGLWLGPSPIKEAEDHGWGHSIFTGKLIPKGTRVLGSGILDQTKNEKVFGELLIPIYDWESIDMASVAADEDDEFFDDDNIDNRKKNNALMKKRVEEALKGSDVKEPPLFHQTWQGDAFQHEVLESVEGMRVFMPGLASVSPCTYRNFNLEQVKIVTYRDWRNLRGIGHDESPPSPQAGSFSYLSNSWFTATRDILPGEELVIECSDNSDNFDPSTYPPTKFVPKEAGGYSICLDDKVEERLADHTPNVAGGAFGGQRGVFAKRPLKKDEIITSTPMVPVHKEETMMDREKYKEMIQFRESLVTTVDLGVPIEKKQLLENYLFGHPDSSLRWLATMPLLHSVNHAPHDQIKTNPPNAKIQWHHDEYTDAQAAGKPLTRRQQFHHAELLKLGSLEVVLKHGMGLMIDLVALRDIGENEEILIDYGKAWDDAWKKHTEVWQATIDSTRMEQAKGKEAWKKQREAENEQRSQQKKNLNVGDEYVFHKTKIKHTENAMTVMPLASYVTSSDFNHLEARKDILTISEQRRKPYPPNVETACYFEVDWLDSDINEDQNAELTTYKSWYEQGDDPEGCLLPCIITERRDYEEGEENEIIDLLDDDGYKKILKEHSTINGGSSTTKRYTAKLVDNHEQNTSVSYECHIFSRFQYFMMDIPREGITFVDKLHSSDSWIEQAFRQPIGLPEDMVPPQWRDLNPPKGRTRGGNSSSRKKTQVSAPKEMTVEQFVEEKKYQQSIKKWTEAESRQELLDGFYEKHHSYYDYEL